MPGVAWLLANRATSPSVRQILKDGRLGDPWPDGRGHIDSRKSRKSRCPRSVETLAALAGRRRRRGAGHGRGRRVRGSAACRRFPWGR